MIKFAALLKSAEADLLEQNPDVLKRMVQGGVLYSLVRQTIRQYTKPTGQPQQLTDLSIRVFETLIKAGAADDVLFAEADTAAPPPQTVRYAPTPDPIAPEASEELVRETPVAPSPLPATDGDFATMSEAQIRAMANVFNFTERETSDLLRAKGMLSFKDYNPTEDYGPGVQSRSDADLAMDEARKENALAGIAGFGVKPEDLITQNHTDPTTT